VTASYVSITPMGNKLGYYGAFFF